MATALRHWIETGRSSRHRLTPRMEYALGVIYQDDRVLYGVGGWIGASNRAIRSETIEAMFERGFIVIGTESRHRRRYEARLSEVGVHLARGLAINSNSIPVESAELIQEIVNADELLAPDMLDDPNAFPFVYAGEELCECPDESELAVEVSGEKIVCMNCGKRKI